MGGVHKIYSVTFFGKHYVEEKDKKIVCIPLCAWNESWHLWGLDWSIALERENQQIVSFRRISFLANPGNFTAHHCDHNFW